MTALEKQQKKISVIIPVYNAEKYIREASVHWMKSLT